MLQADKWKQESLERDAHIRHKCFPKIDDTVVNYIAAYSPLVEVGAGTGYLASRLEASGADIVATDKYPPHTDRNPYGWKHEHIKVKQMSAATAVKAHPDRNVLMSWPSYGKRWAYLAAKCIKKNCHLLYIGEGPGGCTANDAFFKLMDTDFHRIDKGPLDSFFGLHDELLIFKRHTNC